MESEYIKYPWGKVWENSNGDFHRENDLSAYENNNGYKSWHINGKLHREFGPAIIYSDGREHWYLNGIQYTPENMPIKLYIEYLKREYKKSRKEL